MAERNNSLEPFYEWLVGTRGVSIATARVYKSNAGTALKGMGAVCRTQEGVNAYFLSLARDRPATYPAIRAAWMRFVEYVEDNGASLPRPTVTAKKEKSLSSARLPLYVREALRRLRAVKSPTLREVTYMTWDDVDMSALTLSIGIYNKVRRPGRPGEYVLVSAEVLRDLRRWAQPTEGQTTALVPVAPGRRDFVPYSALMDESDRLDPDE